MHTVVRNHKKNFLMYTFLQNFEMKTIFKLSLTLCFDENVGKCFLNAFTSVLGKSLPNRQRIRIQKKLENYFICRVYSQLAN